MDTQIRREELARIPSPDLQPEAMLETICVHFKQKTELCLALTRQKHNAKAHVSTLGIAPVSSIDGLLCFQTENFSKSVMQCSHRDVGSVKETLG